MAGRAIMDDDMRTTSTHHAELEGHPLILLGNQEFEMTRTRRMLSCPRWLLFVLIGTPWMAASISCRQSDSNSEPVEEGSATATGVSVDPGKDAALLGAATNPLSSYGDGLRFLRSPRLKSMDVPDFHGANSIWGATGRDKRGNIYFGVASSGVDDPSARLLRYSPREQQFDVMGIVNEELEKLKVRRQDPFEETQMKIHSKIFEAGDGNIYFSSQDEHDEAEDGSRNTLFGGRLFSVGINSKKWECVLTAPEGLIAVAGGKRFVYALGYFGHVIYRYDVQKKSLKSVKLGTFRGHVSRNIFVDSKEHVYGILLAEYRGVESSGVSMVAGVPVRAYLVELDEDLNEISEWPLDDYQPTGDVNSHGITGYARLLDGNIVFVTHSGSLWRLLVTPKSSKLERLGWVHPEGTAYCSTLYAPTGKDYVMGFTNTKNGPHEWFVFDLKNRRSTLLRLDLASQAVVEQEGLLVYGCDTLDDQGNAYAVGWKKSALRNIPSAIQIRWDSRQ
jgi:hypothetical protein